MVGTLTMRIGPKMPARHYMREWREAKNLTQQQLADRLETGKDTISRYESGNRKMTLDMAAAVAYALDPELDQLAIFRHPDQPSADALLRKATPQQRAAVLSVISSILATGTGE